MPNVKTIKTYSEAIRGKYLIDKESGKLRGELYKLTPANVRKLCLNLIIENLSEFDKTIMKNVFESNDFDIIRGKIKKYEIEKFKPICKFLKKENESMSSHELLELTAILLNFNPRPYTKYGNEKINNEIEAKSEKNKEPEEKKEKEDDKIIPIPFGIDNKEESKNDKPNKEEVTINNYQRIIIYTKNNVFKLILFTFLVVCISVYVSINQQRWMVWENDHYIEVKFDTEKYNINQLKLYKEERILNFKLIENPDCKTEYFKSDGSENVWYGKNTKGKLEYFTDLGLHPETGNTLKKITKYMIREHICKDYEK